MGNLIYVVAEPVKALAEEYRLLKPEGKLILLSYTKDGMSFLSILTMIYRYLKVLDKLAKDGTRFGLKMLIGLSITTILLVASLKTRSY